jgi:hypothetical protein
MENIFNTFSYKKEHINVKKIQKFEKVTSPVKMSLGRQILGGGKFAPKIFFCLTEIKNK